LQGVFLRFVVVFVSLRFAAPRREESFRPDFVVRAEFARQREHGDAIRGKDE